ncbi:alpha/beta fold hydrolase [Streptomyces pinistramenti]|uniref:alpha/beta fold hydrolase n=1 Tax=Streptomyces pinistramenti TaxID=2884812 RepID=UPI001D079371|nr:alpha/beta hydrolase [Streptomyces pinistramenti]MCB5907504.1 alpha/beta hydrolase [Streptomyces pinistramenti]
MSEQDGAATDRGDGAPGNAHGDVLHELAAALMDTGSLISSVPEPLRVAPLPGGERWLGPVQDVLDRLTGRLALPRVEAVPDTDGLWAAELAISRRLALDAPALARAADGPLAAAVRAAVAGPPGEPVVLPAHDGTPLRAYAAGRPGRPAIVAVPACGMPVGLVAPWLRALSGSYRVLTWESRALFAARNKAGLPPLLGHDLPTQGRDLLAVLDGFGVAKAHVMGLCGGAPLALAAAAVSPRITSLSLWHGDFELGGDAPKTTHQKDVESLLAMAGRGPEQAAGLYRLMRRPRSLDKLRPDVAHHLVHPYASPELLRRYGLLNGAIMTTDCRPLLSAVHQPTLVVTSPEDHTAHPDGSVHAARLLSHGALRSLPHGDHLTAFDAGPELVGIAEAFIRDHDRKGRP